MFKLGVYRPSQYVPNDARRSVWPRRTRWAYSLLRTSIPPSTAEIEMFEEVMRHVHLAEGVYRTTGVNRFETLNAFLVPLLKAHFEADLALRAQDWAASACVTSAEWYESLKDAFPGVQLTASDLHLYLVEISLPDATAYIVEAEGQPLQYVQPPFVIPLNRVESRVLLVNHWLQRRARQRFEELKKKGLLGALDRLNSQNELHEGSLLFRKVPLLHPKALALEQSTSAFRIEPHSVFDALAEPCHLIRTMNIFNLVYFGTDQLMAGAGAVWRSLCMNGVWVVGRTLTERVGKNPALHNVSVFEKSPSGFRLLDRYGAGSEIEHLALAFEA